MHLDRRIALIEAVAARWAKDAAHTALARDPRSRLVRTRSKELATMLTALRKARQTAHNIVHRIDALLIESGADDAVAERAALQEAA